jgi:hypothetical protein
VNLTLGYCLLPQYVGYLLQSLVVGRSRTESLSSVTAAYAECTEHRLRVFVWRPSRHWAFISYTVHKQTLVLSALEILSIIILTVSSQSSTIQFKEQVQLELVNLKELCT